MPSLSAIASAVKNKLKDVGAKMSKPVPSQNPKGPTLQQSFKDRLAKEDAGQTKERPASFARDAGNALVDTFNPDTGSVGGDVKEFAKRVVKGGAQAAAYPITAPAGLAVRLAKGVGQNIEELRTGKPSSVEGSQDEEFSGLSSKYGSLTGSAIGVAKGTLEGAAGAQGGKMLGQAYMAAKANPALNAAMQDQTGRIGPKDGKSKRTLPHPLTGKPGQWNMTDDEFAAASRVSEMQSGAGEASVKGISAAVKPEVKKLMKLGGMTTKGAEDAVRAYFDGGTEGLIKYVKSQGEFPSGFDTITKQEMIIEEAMRIIKAIKK